MGQLGRWHCLVGRSGPLFRSQLVSLAKPAGGQGSRQAGQPWRVLAAPQLWLCARGEGIATELGSERGCVCLGAAPRLVWTGLASGLPRGPSGRGSLCLGSQVGLARGPEAVGHFPEAVLGSDSPVTVETETPSRLFQCVSPFPGRASPCHSSARPAPPRRLGPALWETGLQGRPGIPGHAPACVRGGREGGAGAHP